MIITLLLFQSCATSKFVVTGNTYTPYTGPVKVFQSSPEGVEYEEIGIVSSTGGEVHEWTHLIEAMQKKAASYGVNAIIIIKEDKIQKGSIAYTQYGLYGGTTQYKSLMSVAIRIK
jgi:hypothetical protein